MLFVRPSLGYWLSKRGSESPKYSFDEIQDSIRVIQENEKVWEEYFAKNNIKPHQLFYEDVVDEYVGAIEEAFNFLKISIDTSKIVPVNIQRQAVGINNEWFEKFIGEQKQK